MSVSKLVLSVTVGVTAIVVLGGAAMTAATQVNIVDPTISARVAHVDAGNRLAVQEVPPSTYFHASADVSVLGCVLITNAPAGRALVVRQVRLDFTADPSPGADNYILVYENSGCGGSPIAKVNPPTLGLTTVAFDPGLAIAEGSGLSAILSGAVKAEADVDGYTVAPSVAPLVGQVIQAYGRNGQS